MNNWKGLGNTAPISFKQWEIVQINKHQWENDDVKEFCMIIWYSNNTKIFVQLKNVQYAPFPFSCLTLKKQEGVGRNPMH